jgi:hypothetical protein
MQHLSIANVGSRGSGRLVEFQAVAAHSLEDKVTVT